MHSIKWHKIHNWIGITHMIPAVLLRNKEKSGEVSPSFILKWQHKMNKWYMYSKQWRKNSDSNKSKQRWISIISFHGLGKTIPFERKNHFLCVWVSGSERQLSPNYHYLWCFLYYLQTSEIREEEVRRNVTGSNGI